MMELRKWSDRELELSRRHEELIMRREALLRSTESYMNATDELKSTFCINDADNRNRVLRQEIHDSLVRLQNEQQNQSPRFEKLTKNYWSMVKSVFPVWLEELERERTRPKSSDRLKHIPQPDKQPVKQSIKYSPKPSPKRYQPPPDKARRVRWSDDELTFNEVPPLDLDFSMGEDITSQNITPKPTPKKEKRVLFDEAQLLAAKQSKDTSGRSKSKSKKS